MNIYAGNNTIAAIATPLGVGGVGVIRISGNDSEEIIKKIFSSTLKERKLPEFKPNRVYYGWIYENNLHPVDEVILLYFKAPKSFTGENIFEIQCHGGVNIVQKILKLCIDNGARLAEQGEFSKRAFMNGKIDLSRAESILDLIHSKTDTFSKLSALNLSGRLAEKIYFLRTELINLLSLIIAAVDFPEEVDEPEYNYINDKILSLINEIEGILNGATASNLMRNGVKAAIVGKPNAGKSSLFNALLDVQRAIVTDIPGTTRDIIQESVDIEGIPLTLIDTAGLREIKSESDNNYIEALGINLTNEAIKTADIIIYIYDLAKGLTEEDNKILESIKNRKNLLKVGSKLDLAQDFSSGAELIKVSSKEKIGLNELKQAVKSVILSDSTGNDEFCTNLRQQECLKNSKKSLLKAVEACNRNEHQDLISIDLKSALISLGEITGEV
ncbi:MAG TPA: tRNA uridine-5-carboxymethylaminomethyl(34) synthesis GTPase MnmE, partial [Candidatus Gastranaerophilales bacterium]|nr:tRNA uridine-5-carboxymethylaminomethyl(34) synthesis GTPase MnmE [Candidatus Gastranaerophilales bacterium]